MNKYRISFSDGDFKDIEAEQFALSDGCALFVRNNLVFAAYKVFVFVEMLEA